VNSLTENLKIQDKSKNFQVAMETYHNNILYNKFFIFVSIAIVSIQSVSVLNLYQKFYINNDFIDYLCMIVSIFFAYIAADFMSGAVHMYMDNNTNYKSIAGPFIAAFHMHHRNMKYKTRHPLMIYVIESGSKFWLVVYLGMVIFLQYQLSLVVFINIFLVAFGVFSSFAEVSHYWCHNAHNKNSIIKKLQKFKILLPKKHHLIHHTQDNVNYAFLNGVTDPILNILAKKFYKGYKNSSDRHAANYKGPQTNNR